MLSSFSRLPSVASLACLGALVFTPGCGDDSGGDAGTQTDAATNTDAGMGLDQGSDAGSNDDLGTQSDAGTAADSGAGDAGGLPDGCSGTLVCSNIQDPTRCAATPGCSQGSGGCEGTTSLTCMQLTLTPQCVDSGCTWTGVAVCQVAMSCNPDEFCCGTMCMPANEICRMVQ